MSTPSPFGGGNPLEHLLGDLLKLISNAGPLQWDLARQLALAVSTDGQPEPNVDPIERIRLQELMRVADLHIGDATGLATSVTSGIVTALPVKRSDWALRTLDAWRPLIESLAASLAEGPGGHGEPGSTEAGGQEEGPGADLEPAAGLAGLMGSLGKVMGPAILGLQVGSALGHLARRAMGSYVLPVPRPPTDELLLVPANLDQFSGDWSLPIDDVRMWVCLSELAHHTVISRPHVRERLEQLIRDYSAGFQPDTSALEARLSGVDPTDPAALQAAMGDPTALLGEMQTPAQRRLLAELDAVVLALEGYVDHVMDSVGHRLITSYPSLTEALRRRRVERDGGERMVEQLFGLELSQARFDRGAAFVRGVVERAGDEGLGRLWESSATLPTPAEIDAPGLWLARISLPGETGSEPGA